MAPKRMSNAERKRRKRECERKRRQKIKDDPDRLAAENKKQRIRYARRKSKKKAISARDQRQQRKKWREQKNKYRMKLKAEERLEPSRQKVQAGKSKARKLAKVYYANEKLTTKNLKLKKKCAKYMQRYYRLLAENMKRTNSPRSKVLREFRRGRDRFISKKVRRRLLFAESLRSDLQQTFSSCKKVADRKVLQSILQFSSLKKYNFMTSAKPMYNLVVRSPRRRHELGSARMKNRFIKKMVLDFYLQDDVTIVAPGKKDCIRGVQKRYLTNSLKVLYKKFCVSDIPVMISYSTFCRMKPFYVVMKDFSSRDTCLCVKHENMKFIIKQLWRDGVLASSDPDIVGQDLLCTDRKLECYFRECEFCAENEISIILQNFNGTEETSYDAWVWKTEEVNEKEIRRLIKERQTCSMHELVQLAVDKLPDYIHHTANDTVQKTAMKDLRRNLRQDEALLHIDFAENYNCKYAAEVQGVHFGGSRQQITLHTCMLYVGQERKEPLCTISESLQHDPIGIFVFLRPILKELGPEIKHLHFLSDSPVTQYRNKNMFFLMCQKIPELFPNLEDLSWHYTEAGHGKGAADGIGGTLKRTCDRLVGYNQDVSNFAQFSAAIAENVPGVRIYSVLAEAVEEFEKKISKILKAAPQFKGETTYVLLLCSIDSYVTPIQVFMIDIRAGFKYSATSFFLYILLPACYKIEVIVFWATKFAAQSCSPVSPYGTSSAD